MSEDFNFRENIEEVLRFESILPPRHREELEILILVSQECWFRLKEKAYFSPNISNKIDLNCGTLYGFKYSVDLGLTGFKFKPVLQRKTD